jgi:hypothetical protein
MGTIHTLRVRGPSNSVDGLPGAEAKPALLDRHGHVAAEEAGLDVGVGVAFAVPVVSITGDEPGEPGDDVPSHRRVGALVDGDPRGGVGDENAHHAGERSPGFLGKRVLDEMGDVYEGLPGWGGNRDLDQGHSHVPPRTEVEVRGLEPLAFAMRTRRSPN